MIFSKLAFKIFISIAVFSFPLQASIVQSNTLGKGASIKCAGGARSEHTIGKLKYFRGGFSASTTFEENRIGEDNPETLRINTTSLSINGDYKKTLWDVNGRAHYEKDLKADPKGSKLHLYWSGVSIDSLHSFFPPFFPYSSFSLSSFYFFYF